jgi:hypothetical protein
MLGGVAPKQQRHPGHGSGGPRPIVRGTVLRVQVQRAPARTRPPRVLWLWWTGPDGVQLDLDLAWRAYVRRFDLEHTVRFAKQPLGRTIPRPRTPEQADRWTGWCWPATPSCGWPAGSPATSGCRGSGPDPNRGYRLTGCAAGFAAAVRAGLAGRCAETLRAFPRTTQGPCLRACDALPGHQEAHRQAQAEGDQDRQGRLTDPSQHHPAADEVSSQSACPPG